METVFEILEKMSGSGLRGIHSTNSKDKIFVEVPGFTKSDLEVSLERNMLTIKGEKEIGGEKFQLKKTIWTSVNDPDSLDLSLEHGLLIVQIKDSVKKRKLIEIR